ncbi:phage tail sheath subtilisin-like domain-containing protein [Yoonia sp. SS1-5]|uniref:Phage tail sheath subtilisin-like domain-containing protein n=1 Tax=Yoonia rhodophyticola TaxID=3137370 RepID=A0AAN0MC53_9RHOB
MLTIPGVEITVVKELVPRGLAAAGTLGIVGPCEIANTDQPLRELSTIQEFRDLFGAGSITSMPEVELAFANGLRAVIVAALPATAGVAATATIPVSQTSAGGDTRVEQMAVTARAAGRWGNDLRVRFLSKGAGSAQAVDVFIYTSDAAVANNRAAETFRNLSTQASDPRFFMSVINGESGLIRMAPVIPAFIAGGGSAMPENTNATAAPTPLINGQEATVAEYSAALERLETQPQIDMVIASNLISSTTIATELYSTVISHCEAMSRKAQNRIGFGQIVPHGTARPDIDAARTMAGVLTSDRFVLTAPFGTVGAVAGLVSGQQYFRSPTYKTLRGIVAPNFDFTDGDLRALLRAGLLPVDKLPRKGVAVIKGIATSQEQINVQRTADRAVRTVQNIAIDYVGLLNNQAQRSALRQRIDEAFNAMFREGALVPSADGLSPPYEVEVTATNAEAAAGIVRIGIAVRPVRAIDFIYATLNVKAF